MATPTRPTNIDLPFAVSGTKNTIPDAPTGSNLASYTQGFPPITMLPIASGGIPPDGDDFNGILYNITSHTLWVNAGGQYIFDAALSSAIGGYPKGMVLQNNALNASYVSLIDNNTNNFNTDPSQIGVTWGAYSGAAFSNVSITTTGGTTTLTAIQAIADMITVSGLLTSNATIIVPTATSQFTFVNNTTGAYSLTVITASGTGVTIKQGGADYVICDGTNVQYGQASAKTRNEKDASTGTANTFYADRAADHVGGGYQDTGTTNAYVIATIPPTTTPVNFQTVRFRAATTSTGGATTLDVGGGALPLVLGDGNTPRAGDINSSAITTATYVSALNKWVINGLIVPDILISNAIYVTATQTLSRGNFIFNTSAGSFGCNLNSLPSIGDTIYGADPTGDWRGNPLTISATGGIQIAYKDYTGTLQTMSSLVADIAGAYFQLTYDGTYWRLS